MLPKTVTLTNGENLEVREATADDAPGMLEYIEAISGESEFLTFGPGEFDVTEAQEREFLERYHVSDNQIYVVGLIGGELAAIMHFAAGQRPRLRHTGEFGMSVRKRYWGQGIGSVMLDSLLEWARDTGIVTKVNLRVRTDNGRAIGLYESRGFVLEGTVRREFKVGGVYHDCHWMGLEL